MNKTLASRNVNIVITTKNSAGELPHAKGILIRSGNSEAANATNAAEMF